MPETKQNTLQDLLALWADQPPLPADVLKFHFPEILGLVPESVRPLLSDTLAAIQSEFPKLRQPIFVADWVCFVSEVTAFRWLLHLTRKHHLEIGDTIKRLHDFRALDEVEVAVYAFYVGLALRNFGPDLEYQLFTIGPATRYPGHQGDRQFPSGTYRHDELFVRVRLKESIVFGGEPKIVAGDGIVATNVIKPLEARMGLFEAQAGSPLYVVASGLSFDDLRVPLGSRAWQKGGFFG
jgi:hypothetical protein